jgi:hypothetical protein
MLNICVFVYASGNILKDSVPSFSFFVIYNDFSLMQNIYVSMKLAPVYIYIYILIFKVERTLQGASRKARAAAIAVQIPVV